MYKQWSASLTSISMKATTGTCKIGQYLTPLHSISMKKKNTVAAAQHVMMIFNHSGVIICHLTSKAIIDIFPNEQNKSLNVANLMKIRKTSLNTLFEYCQNVQMCIIICITPAKKIHRGTNICIFHCPGCNSWQQQQQR